MIGTWIRGTRRRAPQPAEPVGTRAEEELVPNGHEDKAAEVVRGKNVKTRAGLEKNAKPPKGKTMT